VLLLVFCEILTKKEKIDKDRTKIDKDRTKVTKNKSDKNRQRQNKNRQKLPDSIVVRYWCLIITKNHNHKESKKKNHNHKESYLPKSSLWSP